MHGTCTCTYVRSKKKRQAVSYRYIELTISISDITVGLDRTMYVVDEDGFVETCIVLTGELRRSVVVKFNTVDRTASG